MAAVPSAKQLPGHPEHSISVASPSARRAREVAWSLLLSFPQTDGLAALLPGRPRAPRSIQTALLAKQASANLPRLLVSTRTFSVADALAAAVPLLGAGPGLTPSWDDLLIGYLCGLRATSAGKSERTSFLGRIGEAIYLASVRTTAASRFYIERTARGCGPGWVEAVLGAISRGDCALADRSMRTALRVGRTSGTDMMLGAMLGLSVWQPAAQGHERRILAAMLREDLQVHGEWSADRHGTH